MTREEMKAICNECEKDEYYTGCDADKCTIWLMYQEYTLEEINEIQENEE